jgi:hypothetical protein
MAAPPRPPICPLGERSGVYPADPRQPPGRYPQGGYQEGEMTALVIGGAVTAAWQAYRPR